MTYTESFPIQFKPIAHPDAIVTGPAVRFAVLSSRLLRLEYSPDERFEDRPSQAFWYREQAVPDYQVRRAADRIEIETAHLHLNYQVSDAGFTPETLSVRLKELDRAWHYGDVDADNLLGTARTLDRAHGAIELEPGLLSRSGWAVVDDTERLVFDSRGWVVPRDALGGYRDLYLFGYGHDYAACLRDFCQVAGPVPLLPRWVLGNWWSRYWAYSADELLDLMAKFQEHEVPLSVCIVDMDWHTTDTGNRSSGWTGYTWNRDLFPDPPAFIDALHQLGLRTALNLHPALGVYPHEAQYRAMAARMGLDPDTGEAVPFEISDPQFAAAYFELLHHPQEEQGIDFWWLDWQQGTDSAMPGLDPLWWLNHLHFYDLGREGKKRPFVFSRWGGLGNHRYPIGFSGDTVVSWESLAFQPYFTATAANVNYGWWSHDIGGHMGGIEDAELFARWVQFGVFSPILRLHSTKNPYHERRPWGYDAETLRVTREALQFRHRLIPYLYTLSWRNHDAAVPPVRPMYHDHPEQEPAYHCPDQYAFGSELIAAPFITPADRESRMSRQVVWLPPGQWFHLFSGLPYPGDGWHAIYGGLDEIPVFAKAGTILPLAPPTGWDGVEAPAELELQLFPGADNRFELYEDDGLSTHSLTPFTQTWGSDHWRFEIGPAEGTTDHLPARRAYTLRFHGVSDADVRAHKNGEPLACDVSYDANAVVLTLSEVTLAPTDALTVTLQPQEGPLLAERDHRLPRCRQLLRACRLDTNVKQMLAVRLNDLLAHPEALADFELALPTSVARALAEILIGAGLHQATDPASGGERILLWNNTGSDAVTYRFTGLPLTGLSAARLGGSLPRFAAFVERGELLRLETGAEPGRVDSVAEWLDDLRDSHRPHAASDLDLVIQFTFTGERGLQAHAHISPSGLSVTGGVHAHPDLALEVEAADWLALINGDVDPTELFLAGKLQISGDMTLALRLADLLGGGGPQRQFRNAPWKLRVNLLDMFRLELER